MIDLINYGITQETSNDLGLYHILYFLYSKCLIPMNSFRFQNMFYFIY